MATLGEIVLYTFDAAQAHVVHMRGERAGLLRFPGLPDPVAGTTLPGMVVHEYGDGVVDLVVQMRGPGRHFIQSVSEGTSGQQGRWTALPI